MISPASGLYKNLPHQAIVAQDVCVAFISVGVSTCSHEAELVDLKFPNGLHEKHLISRGSIK